MKLKLLIALVAVPTLVMAQAGLPSANVGSSVQTGATPTQQTAPNPNSTTGSSAATGSSTTPTNVGGKADKYGSTGYSGPGMDFDVSSGKTTSKK